MERLQKILSNSGVASRRTSEKLILDGRVSVDGKVIRELGTKVSINSVIEVDGIKISREEKVYYLLNKPRGVVCTAKDEKGRKTVVGLVKENRRIYPVGRLDYDTTGAIILTNDGELANALMHPKNKIDKVYIAKVNGIPTINQIMNLKKGVLLDGVLTSKAKVKIKKQDLKTNTSIIEIIVHEGKNHQVKRMFESVGLKVLKLKRERFAFLDLSGLNSKDYRMLNPKEVKRLYDLVSNKK